MKFTGVLVSLRVGASRVPQDKAVDGQCTGDTAATCL